MIKSSQLAKLLKQKIQVTAFKEMCDKFYDYAEVGKVGWRDLVLHMIVIYCSAFEIVTLAFKL